MAFFVDSSQLERQQVVYHVKANAARSQGKAEAKGVRGQGKAFSKPRPRTENFVLEVSSTSTTVVDDPISGDSSE